MKVAFDISQLNKLSLNRGIGIHAKNLYAALKQYTSVDVDLIEEKTGYDQYDLIHIPFFDLFTRSLPLKASKPLIVTVHDLIPIMYPAHYPPGLKGKFNWQIQKIALKQASGIIAISDAVKKDIVKILNYESSKIDVVYIAPSKGFRRIDNKSGLEETRKKLNLPEEFILYVGNVNWNKNILNMTEGVLNAGKKLVIIGGSFSDLTNLNHPEKKAFKKWIEKYGENNEITLLNSLKDDDLVKVMNLASSLIFVSFAEGFGLPIIEAQTCGLPVITSKGGATEEIAGNSALLVDPEDISEITAAVTKITMSPDLRKKLIKEGEANLKRFSWKEIALQTVKAYEKAIS